MAVVATAGHVDHGKSTLVRALTGTDPDRLAEEKRRGLTLDLGFAWCDLDGVRVSFVDVPGHQRYVGTMLAGVGPLAAVLLVVAADDGWAAQTEEHVEAIAALGLRHVVVAVTRADLADPTRAMSEAADRLARHGLVAADCIPTSAPTGTGLAPLRDALRRLALSLPAPDPVAPVRLWVDRSFTIRGAGTVVTGTLTDGTIRSGDPLDAAGHRVTVRDVQSAGESVSEVRGTARVALNLRGVSATDLGRGDLVATPGIGVAGRVAEVRLYAVPARPPRELTVHVGTASAPVRFRLRPDGRARLTTVAATGLPWSAGDHVVLRDPGAHRVLAGGVVETLVADGARRRGPPPAAAGLHHASLGDPPPALAELLHRLSGQPFDAPPADWAARHGVTAHDLATAERTGSIVRLGGTLLGPDALEVAVARLVALPAGFSPGDAARALGASRRVTLALLGRLDAVGHTSRHADGTRTLVRP